MSEDAKWIVQNLIVLAIIWSLAVGAMLILDDLSKRPLPSGDRLYAEAYRRNLDIRQQIDYEKRSRKQDAARKEWEGRK